VLVPKEMTMRLMTPLTLFLAILVADATSSRAPAQEFPSRAVTIIVPFSAGGPADTAARTFADVMRKHFGQPVIVENRPAAGGTPATEYVAQNGHDGYTLLLGGIAGLALIPPVQKVRYTVEDFAPLGLIWRSPQVFAVRNGLPVQTAAEFVAYAKANPDKLTFGSAGIGTVTHLAGELLQRETGIKLVHVPFRSTVNSLTDLMGEHIDAIFGDVAILRPHVQSKAIKPLGITSYNRSGLLPDLVTMKEAGFPGVHTEVWYGVLAQAHTPAPALAKLREATAAAQNDPEFAERLMKFGISLPEAGAESFGAFIHSEIDRWKPIVTSVRTN
jgi:tripartite-type tricarboxylate transporter receptor subunit TctC